MSWAASRRLDDTIKKTSKKKRRRSLSELCPNPSRRSPWFTTLRRYNSMKTPMQWTTRWNENKGWRARPPPAKDFSQRHHKHTPTTSKAMEEVSSVVVAYDHWNEEVCKGRSTRWRSRRVFSKLKYISLLWKMQTLHNRLQLALTWKRINDTYI